MTQSVGARRAASQPAPPAIVTRPLWQRAPRRLWRLVPRLLARLGLGLGLVLGLVLGACATGGRANVMAPVGVSAVTSPQDMTAPAPIVRVYDTKAARWTTFAVMAARLSRADVVFFGEQHDDPDTHAAELSLFAALGGARTHTVLSLEMFERDVQPVLDRYLGNTLTEAEFLAGSRPWDRYATDYRGMVEIARVRGWPVVAANIPRRIASAVSRRGLGVLDTLSPPERGFAARTNACPHDAYYEKFAETMQGHSAGEGPASAADAASMRTMTDLFYQAQCTKDEAMAESIAAASRAAGRDALVLHVNGSFHSDFGLGTAARVRQRLPGARIALVTALPVDDIAHADPKADALRADYLIFTVARSK